MKELESFERLVRKAGYQAGRMLYGDDLVWTNSNVMVRRVSDRVREMIMQECAEEVIANIDTYEYAFFMDGTGIDCADELVIQERLVRDGCILLYCPECGIDVLRVDVNMKDVVKIINDEVDY